MSKSVKEKRGHTSDQGEVWSEVCDFHAAYGVQSETAAMADAFDSYQDQIAACRDELRYVPNASGIAVAIGDKVVSVDLFDKPTTCRETWDRMLSGVAFDAMEAGETEKIASVADVEQLIATAVHLSWTQSEAVGEGEEYRASSEEGDHSSALALDETVVHGSVLANITSL